LFREPKWVFGKTQSAEEIFIFAVSKSALEDGFLVGAIANGGEHLDIYMQVSYIDPSLVLVGWDGNALGLFDSLDGIQKGVSDMVPVFVLILDIAVFFGGDNIISALRNECDFHIKQI
jgi:hypothetical protein